ncbi:hypothetical protein KUCAC02_031956 [Chaenocephalus aceratus]|nr:hypothetical protein KUCAC02_031956 [Chaenocephalus aceratus]
MPVVVKMTSATAVNLSLLTADLFSLFCGLFLFHYSFSTLYTSSPSWSSWWASSCLTPSRRPEAQREPERRDTKRGETQRPSETPTLETLCE